MTPTPLPPPPARPGSRLGVAGLSGAVEPAALATGLGALEALGFEVVPATNLEAESGLFAGSDRDRLAAFHDLLADDSIDAFLFARGGHGLLRLLHRLDWDLLARRPRWFGGYSDLTPLLMAIVQRLGWQVLHAPMVGVEMGDGFTPAEAESLLKALAGDQSSTFALGGVDGSWGDVEAPLAGGCLSMLISTLGTPWAVPTAGSVLFLEDVAEPLYRVDRMLQQLRLAGLLEEVHGIVLGAFDPPESAAYSAEDLVAAVRDAAGADVPIAWGCTSGHCRPNLTLTLGARARVEGGALRLSAGS